MKIPLSAQLSPARQNRLSRYAPVDASAGVASGHGQYGAKAGSSTSLNIHLHMRRIGSIPSWGPAKLRLGAT